MATGDSSTLLKKGTLVKGMAAPSKAEIPLGVMKVLDSRQLKPDSMEAERILTVLDETIVKLEITRLILWIIGSLERYARMLGPEITSRLLEHQKLSVEVQHLLSSPGDEESRRAVEQRLKCSMRNILRLFLANPLLYHGLKYEVRVRESPADVFVKAFVEFRDFTLERLLTSPEEEKEKIQFVEGISLEVEKNTEIISALQEELAAAIQTRDEEVNRKDKTIENLKTSMENVVKGCQADIKQIMKEGEKQQKEDENASQDTCARLEQDIQRLEAHFNELVLKHRASELVLRKVKGRRALGQEVSACLQSCQLWLLPAARSSLVPAHSWQDAHGVCQSTPALSSCSADCSGKQPCSDSRDSLSQVLLLLAALARRTPSH
ncbi:hypothetical protein Nmel_015666 [Mimus melanotis]